MTNEHDTSAFEHPCPHSGYGHCHHVRVVEGCHFCWDHLANVWAQAEMGRQEFVETAEYGENVKRWAEGRRIEDIPAEFDRLRSEAEAAGEKDRQIKELQAENADLRSKLHDVIASQGRRGRYWGRK